MNDEIQIILKRILSSLSVDLNDEFDKNFTRQGFFSSAWQRRRSPLRKGGATLIDTGALRRSVTSRVSGNSVVFYSDLPYSGIHNDGGEIVVTEKMKRFFWAKYYEASGAFGRRKDGTPRRDKRTLSLTEEAGFWKAMALMKVGRTIKIPRRQFIGASPELEGRVREIISQNVMEYLRNEYKLI